MDLFNDIATTKAGKKRPTYLRNLKLTELSLVDHPANKQARVCIFKRADPAEAEFERIVRQRMAEHGIADEDADAAIAAQKEDGRWADALSRWREGQRHEKSEAPPLKVERVVIDADEIIAKAITRSKKLMAEQAADREANAEAAAKAYADWNGHGPGPIEKSRSTHARKSTMQYTTITEPTNDPLKTDAAANFDMLVDKVMVERRITKSQALDIVAKSPEGHALRLANREQRRANFDNVQKAKPEGPVLKGAEVVFAGLVKQAMALDPKLNEAQASAVVMNTPEGVRAYGAVRAQKRGL